MTIIPKNIMTRLELKILIENDTKLINPELYIRYKSKHQALNKSEITTNEVDFQGNIATRYYEDKYCARSYALTPYQHGVLVLCNKKTNDYTILILGEDDGHWFVPETPYETIHSKSTFMSLISEAISIFNSNYKENK